MRHILRFDYNKYRPMAKGVVAQGHIAESSCWCHPYIMLPIRGGVPVYVHAGLAVTKKQPCAGVSVMDSAASPYKDNGAQEQAASLTFR